MTGRAPQTLRFLELLDQLAEERDHRRGWKAQVARQLGISPSYVTKLQAESSQIDVSDDVLARAARALGIEPRFFTAETGHFQEFRPSDDLVSHRDHADFDAAHAIADALTVENRSPTEEEARRMALHILRWGEAEIAAIRALKDFAEKLLVAGGDEAQQMGGTLAYEVFMRGSPNVKGDWSGVGEAKLPEKG